MFRVTALLTSWVSGVSGGAAVRFFDLICLTCIKVINVSSSFLSNMGKIEKLEGFDC